MSHESKTEENQELAALYALGALCQHDVRAFEAELRDGDPQLRSDLQSFEKVVEVIGYGAPAAEPPAYLADILMTRLGRVDQVATPATVLPFQERGASPSPLTTIPDVSAKPATGASSAPVSIASRRPSKAATVIPWAIAASLIAASVVAFLAWRQAKQENDDLRQQIAVIQDQTDSMRQQVIAENEKVLELTRINQVLATPEHRVIELGGSEGAPNSSGKIYWDTQARQWAVAAELPPPPAGKVYQLWFVTADAKVSAGLIKTNDKGHAFTVVNVPPDVTGLAAAAITLEPEGGSAQPTMPIFTLGKIG